MPRVVLTVEARSDLKDIARFTAGRWGRDQRDRYMLGLERRLQAVALRPGIGRPRNDLHPGLRSALIGNHLIIYCLVPDGIEVARVLHASMDMPQQFRD